MDEPTPLNRRERRIQRAVEQAEGAAAQEHARLYLDRLRMALHTMDAGDYVALVTGLRDESDEAGARACQELKYPPGTTDPAA